MAAGTPAAWLGPSALRTDVTMQSVVFHVGNLRCTAIHDGDVPYRAEDYVANAPPGEVVEALARHGHDPDAIPSPYSGLLVETAERTVLIDTGAGDLSPRVGHLLDNLRQAGIAPESIDTVLLTHAHPDHIGGNTETGGRAVFPGARYVLSRQEWAWWTDEANLTPLASVFGESVRKNLVPLRDRVELFDGEQDIASGIHVLPTPGHTAGHIAVVLESDGEELIYISDAALHPIHLEHPDWHPVWDQDRERAMASKRLLFDKAAADGAIVLAFHFPPFPSLGRVERRGRGWQWQPIAVGQSSLTSN
jgi:glyoxylase-like metal-dependent hydrolase (beta-lactamase superfamily II)